MKEKGFTLIELLAVIVILAIIALIAVPIIIDIIEDSKTEALKRSAENYTMALKNAIVQSQLDGSKGITGNYTTDTLSEVLNVSYDGEKVTCNTIKIYEDGSIYVADCTVGGESVEYTYGKKQVSEIAEGTIISETTNGVAVNVDNSLVYYVSSGATDATVYGYRGNVDYSNRMNLMNNVPQTRGNMEIALKVKINGEIYNVTSIGDWAFMSMFGAAVNLTSITIPESVTSIGGTAFMDCTSLRSITIPESVTSIGGTAFVGCTSLRSITIPNSVTNIGSDAFIMSGITTININKPSGSIEGAPWGSSATINWIG
ncbi:MAG: leucine-rich repeat domain-containing protein [bacterium]|nr:leucine-rich repeat domain-containing protein [bacterium]